MRNVYLIKGSFSLSSLQMCHDGSYFRHQELHSPSLPSRWRYLQLTSCCSTVKITTTQKIRNTLHTQSWGTFETVCIELVV